VKLKFDLQSGTTTTAWKEAKPICEKIIESLIAETDSELLSQPPRPTHEYYSEIMEDYVDFNVVSRKLKNGLYMNQFAFTNDIRTIFFKANQYMKNDQRVIKLVENL
jgi:Bromodomain